MSQCVHACAGYKVHKGALGTFFFTFSFPPVTELERVYPALSPFVLEIPVALKGVCPQTSQLSVSSFN